MLDIWQKLTNEIYLAQPSYIGDFTKKLLLRRR